MVAPFGPLMRIFVRMGALMLVGPDMCDAWTALSFDYLDVFVKATRNLRTEYYPALRWAARYVDPDVKAVIRVRRRAADTVRSIREERAAEPGAEHLHKDAVQWLLSDYAVKGKCVSSDELAQNLLVMTISSTHQTSMIALWLLFDLIEHPEALAEIKDEIVRVQAVSPKWTRQSLGNLQILDSFMSETMRVHSFTQSTFHLMSPRCIL